MKRIATLILTICAVASSWAGELTRYELKVNEFSQLRVASNIAVDYKACPDSAGMAVFYSDREMTSALMFSTRDDRLEVSLSPDQVFTGPVPRLTIYSSYLTRVENLGDSTVRVLRLKNVTEFQATLVGNGKLVVKDIDATRVQGSLKTGNGTLVLRGRCDKEKISFMGAGTIQADDLQATDVSVSASGTGAVGVWATKFLNIKGVGSTTIYYKGNPQIKKSVAIGLKLKPL